VHHCDSWRIRDQLDANIYSLLFHFFYAQHVSDINKSIIRKLRLFYCITTLVVCSCFGVCWSFGVAGLGWYPCCRLLMSLAILFHFSCVQHVSDINTSIIRNLRLFYCTVLPHWLCVLVSMCVGVSVWLGWGGIRVTGSWCHLLFYFTSSMLNMFRTLIHPSSGTCDFSIVQYHHIGLCSCFDVFWSFGMAGLWWYPCCRLQPATRIPLHVSTFQTVIISSSNRSSQQMLCTV